MSRAAGSSWIRLQTTAGAPVPMLAAMRHQLVITAAVIAAGRARDCPRFSAGRYAAVERPQAAALPLPGYCRR